MDQRLFEDSFRALKQYCEQKRFKGWDPYDGLNSRLFRKSWFYRSKLAREIWIQFFKPSGPEPGIRLISSPFS